MGLANSYLKYEKDLNMVEKYYNLAINIKKIISSEEDSLWDLSPEYLNFAQMYLLLNEKEKAIDMLKNMIENMKINDINKLREFNSIWCFNELKRGERKITMNLYENIFKIFEQPEFDLIKKDEKFIDIINDLEELEIKSLNS
jgi:tetratricopeptide (TPR) repeat protein